MDFHYVPVSVSPMVPGTARPNRWGLRRHQDDILSSRADAILDRIGDLPSFSNGHRCFTRRFELDAVRIDEFFPGGHRGFRGDVGRGNRICLRPLRALDAYLSGMAVPSRVGSRWDKHLVSWRALQRAVVGLQPTTPNDKPATQSPSRQSPTHEYGPSLHTSSPSQDYTCGA
jgi:hypothetical protein